MADATSAASEPEKNGSKLLVAILAAVIAAIAGGGGVYFFAGGKSSAPAESASASKEQNATAKSPAVYVRFDPPFVVNFEAKGMMRFLQVSVEVMTRDPATADLIKLHDPMLRNDLLMLFGSQPYETISTREGKEQLRKEALDAVAKVVAAEGGDAKKVEQMYFTSFVMQ
jgi:flagellar FliL protein